MVGVAAFAYAFAHFCLYIVDQKFDLLHVAAEIALRFYLTIGFVALLGLGALAATSTDKMIKRLGGARWNQLHKLYLRHWRDRDFPLLFAIEGGRLRAGDDDGILLILMIYRALIKRSAPLWARFAGAAVGARCLPLCSRRPGNAIRRHINFWDVLGANIDPDMFPRPTAYVLAAGLIAMIVWAAARIFRRARASRVLAAAE